MQVHSTYTVIVSFGLSFSRSEPFEVGACAPPTLGKASRPLPVLSTPEVLETVAGGDPETAALVRNIRADVAENRAIREALRQKLLQETREEAAAAVAHDGSR